MPNVQVVYGDTLPPQTLQAVQRCTSRAAAGRCATAGLGTIRRREIPYGAPSAAANGDDNDASIDLQTLGSVGQVSLGPAGRRPSCAAAAALPEGSSFTIIDPLLKTATFEFTRDAVVTPGSIPGNDCSRRYGQPGRCQDRDRRQRRTSGRSRCWSSGRRHTGSTVSRWVVPRSMTLSSRPVLPDYPFASGQRRNRNARLLSTLPLMA